MEAKTWQETVMSKDSIEEVKYLEIRDNPEYHDLRLLEKKDVEDRAIAHRQAQLSFSVGKQEGIREVVEWLEHSFVSNFESGEGIVLSISKLVWQAQCKIWLKDE